MYTLAMLSKTAGLIGLILSAGFGANAATIIADFTTLLDGCSASVTLPGIVTNGSANVCAGTIGDVRGIGIQGGGSDVSLDLGETLTIDFGGLVSNVQLQIWDVVPPGNVTFGFTAFNGAVNLGTFSIPSLVTNPTVFNLTALAGQNFSRFTLSETASAPIGLQIQSISAVTGTPEPATFALFGLGLGAVIGFRKRSSKSDA